MDIRTETRPGTTRNGIPELRREWLPVGEPWADVVIVHGIAEHSGRHDGTARVMAARGLAVSSFDLVGFGGSGGRPAFVETWTTFLDQVEERLDDVRRAGRPVVLFGQSMGGLIAIEHCLSERPDPDALVVCAPALRGGAVWQRAIAPLASALAPRLALPNLLDGAQLSRDPQVGEDYFGDPLVRSRTTTRLGAEMFAAMRRVRRHLPRLGVPTLVIQGGSDTIVPPMSTAPLGELPGVERRLYPRLRHEALHEPEGPQLVGEIVDWLESTLTTPAP